MNEQEIELDLQKKIHFEVLDESTLSRVWQHTQDPDTAFAILTAYRKEITNPLIKFQKNVALAAQIHNLGYGHFFLEGYFIENEGKPDEQKVIESSIFVPVTGVPNEKIKKDLLGLAAKYNQESIFFKPAGETKGYILKVPGGEVEQGPLSLSPDKLGKYYSMLTTGPHSGRPFKFESAGIRSGNIAKWGKWLAAGKK